LIAVRIRESLAENLIMKEHEFTLVLVAEPSEEIADQLYGIFNDGTISTVGGVAQVHFHREADSLETAIRSAISDIQAAGQVVSRVEMQPEDVLQAG
jgi:hypothetical protein